MPTVKRFGALAIRIYADDHNPPHFHIEGPEFRVLVSIASLDVIAGHAPARAIAEALRWAAENRADLALKWAELNERDD